MTGRRTSPTMKELPYRSPSNGSPKTVRASMSSHNSFTPTDSFNESPAEARSTGSDDGRLKKRGRKGHSKSRTGCLNCKKARIKCKENRPACDYCAHRGLQCVWPEIQINQVGIVIRNPTPKATIPANPQPTLPVFTMEDFRFFQHFITTAYPHHPLDNDWVWTHDVPSMASDYDFLLHSMLALSASDLADATADRDLIATSISHRVKAIESLNRSVAAGITCWEQGNAMMATCFTLLFQSVLLQDGLGEYIAFLRGIVAIGMQMGQRNMKFIFKKMFGEENMKDLEPGLAAAPLINNDLVSAACRSLERLTPLCKTKTSIGLYALLLSMARNLVTSSRESYMGLRKVYEMFMMMPYDEFREFTDPNNDVCKVLQAHFVAMQLIMTPITRVEWGKSKRNEPHAEGNSGRWLEALHRNIPPHMSEYYEWTLDIEKSNCLGALCCFEN